jgi:hypothetical protein
MSSQGHLLSVSLRDVKGSPLQPQEYLELRKRLQTLWAVPYNGTTHMKPNLRFYLKVKKEGGW